MATHSPTSVAMVLDQGHVWSVHYVRHSFCEGGGSENSAVIVTIEMNANV